MRLEEKYVVLMRKVSRSDKGYLRNRDILDEDLVHRVEGVRSDLLDVC